MKLFVFSFYQNSRLEWSREIDERYEMKFWKIKITVIACKACDLFTN